MEKKEFWGWERRESGSQRANRTEETRSFRFVPMAVSVSASSAIASLNSELSTRLPPSLASASSSAKQSFLQFPSCTRLLRISTPRAPAPSRPRFLPLVQAKKQTYNSFDDLLANSEKPVLVDFYATWCGPCQFMVPILNEVSTRLKDKIQVVKIDTEKYPSIADKYRIEALPTFIMFKDGEPYDRFEGALTADQLIERIEAGLKVKQ
ncbi:thioredoxin Y1, chloroplastic-like isoform X2 [Glycine soja]|uniref:thioredoxin Y1, chloroplastic-like isoform X2 n=1 Tax=Glycine soja TaxID=3848 RepID=UPI00103B3252|nr:thioredoxin Y1, chloroplastic-like isoform X2 [Glycine soja]